MPRNNQGLYTLPLPPVVPNTVIETAWANPTMDDIASALTGSLPRDGSAPMTGPLTLAAGNPTAARHATSKAYVDSFMAYATGMPIGGVIAIAGTTPPAGYIICNGEFLSRTLYADLFAVIGTTYGSGDGSTTFNVPDLRDWFIRGKADARPVGSTQAAAFASHLHGVSDPGHTHYAYQASHDHTITTGGHNHGVNDPGHSHTATFYTHNDNGPLLGNANGGAAGTMTTTTVGTGISIVAVGNLGGTADARQPTVTVDGALSGVSVGVAGGAETRPQNMAMIYVIKAINDSAGPGVITGISSSDTDMIAIDNTNPLVPELDIKSNVAFGTVKLDAGGKVPLSLMPSDPSQFQGYFDASPGLLPVGAFVSGDYFTISVGGTLTVYDPVTLTSSATVVAVGSQIHYVSGSLTNPTGWYYITVSGTILATDVVFTPSGTIGATNVQSAIGELDSETQTSLAGKAPSSAATAVGTSFAPSGNVGATDVQAALVELDTEKASVAYVDAQFDWPAFIANQVGGQTFITDVASKINNTSEQHDANGNYDAPNSRFTPNMAGYYQVNLSTSLTATAFTRLGVYVRKNGATPAEIQSFMFLSGSSVAQNLSGLVYLNGTTDYIEPWVIPTGTGTITAAAGVNNFSASLVRKA